MTFPDRLKDIFKTNISFLFTTRNAQGLYMYFYDQVILYSNGCDIEKEKWHSNSLFVDHSPSLKVKDISISDRNML